MNTLKLVSLNMHIIILKSSGNTACQNMKYCQRELIFWRGRKGQVKTAIPAEEYVPLTAIFGLFVINNNNDYT